MGAVRNESKMHQAASITISVMFHARLFSLNPLAASAVAADARATTAKTTTITG
jgi:hypothetical protein